MVFRAAIQGMTAEVALPDGQLVRPYHVCLAMWGHEVGQASDPGTVKLSEVDPSAEHVPLTIEDRIKLDKELFEKALVALHDETSGKNLAAALREDASGPRLGLSIVVGVPAASGSRAHQLLMEGKKGDPQAVMDMLVAFDRMAAQDPWRGFLQREHLVFGPELEKRFYQRFQTSLRTWIYENSGPITRSGSNRVLGSEQGSSVGMFNGQVLTAGEVQVAGKMSLQQALREHTAGAPPRPITEWASVESRAIAKAIDDKDKEDVIVHWRYFAGAVAAVSPQLDAATGIQVRAIDLLRNAYLEHHGHMETRLAQKFDEEPRQAIRKEMGLTADVRQDQGRAACVGGGAGGGALRPAREGAVRGPVGAAREQPQLSVRRRAGLPRDGEDAAAHRRGGSPAEGRRRAGALRRGAPTAQLRRLLPAALRRHADRARGGRGALDGEGPRGAAVRGGGPARHRRGVDRPAAGRRARGRNHRRAQPAPGARLLR